MLYDLEWPSACSALAQAYNEQGTDQVTEAAKEFLARFIKEHSEHPKAQEAIVWWAGFATEEAMRASASPRTPRSPRRRRPRSWPRAASAWTRPSRVRRRPPKSFRDQLLAARRATSPARRGCGKNFEAQWDQASSRRCSATTTWPKRTMIPRAQRGGRRWKRPPRSSTTFSRRKRSKATSASTPTCGREKPSWNWATTWTWPRTSSRGAGQLRDRRRVTLQPRDAAISTRRPSSSGWNCRGEGPQDGEELHQARPRAMARVLPPLQSSDGQRFRGPGGRLPSDQPGVGQGPAGRCRKRPAARTSRSSRAKPRSSSRR